MVRQPKGPTRLGLPEDFARVRSSEIYFKDGTYAKALNDLYNTKEMAANNIEEAKAQVAFYTELRRRGVYHPDTRFRLGKDAKGRPTMVAVMPRLQLLDREEHINIDKQMVIKSVFQSRGIPHPGTHPDVSEPFNWGMAQDGLVYYHDLHAVNDDAKSAIVRWHEARRKAP